MRNKPLLLIYLSIIFILVLYMRINEKNDGIVYDVIEKDKSIDAIVIDIPIIKAVVDTIKVEKIVLKLEKKKIDRYIADTSIIQHKVFIDSNNTDIIED